jgi:hypothetical protein
MVITCDQGTTFTVENNIVTITKHDQPVNVIPLADLKEFADLLEEDDEDE